MKPITGSRRGWMPRLIAALLTAMIWVLGASQAHAYEEVIYYHNDALGSPVLATDASGNVKWREAYAPYGARLLYQSRETDCTLGACRQVESPWDEKQWFTGKLEETAQGIQYFGARWYDPEIGRFLSVDPVDFNENNIFSFNRYAYANNNPYKYIDPDGRDTISHSVTLNFPSWVGQWLFGEQFSKQGVSAGYAFSFPGLLGGEADVGLFYQVLGGGEDFGMGKYTEDLTYGSGSVRDINGDGIELSVNDGIGGFSANFDMNGALTGIGVHLGPGVNVGGAGTISRAHTIRDAVEVIKSYIGDQKNINVKERKKDTEE